MWKREEFDKLFLHYLNLGSILVFIMFNIIIKVMPKFSFELAQKVKVKKDVVPGRHGDYEKIRKGDHFKYGEFSKYNNTPAIYGLKCKITNKIYIGSTKNIQHRLSKHFSLLYSNEHSNKRLQQDYNEYGYDNFEIIIYNDNPVNLLEEERELQIKIGIDNLYNEKISNYYISKELRTKCANADKSSHKTKEYREKMSKIKTNKVAQYDLQMNIIKIWDSAIKICEELGYTRSVILSCCNGSKPRAYGYNWRYVDDEGNIILNGYQKARIKSN